MAYFYKIITFVICISQMACIIQAGLINLTSEPSIATEILNDFAIGKCRQSCFLKTMKHFSFHNNINSAESVETCRQNPDCYMCYDYCRVLKVASKDLGKAMCGDELFCSKGCRIACKYHHINSIESLIYKVLNSS